MMYKYYVANKPDGSPYKVIAVSTYAGKTVRGVAKCAEGDTFNFETGKELARLRCAMKIAEKRANRAAAELKKACVACEKAEQRYEKMMNYNDDAIYNLEHVSDELDRFINSL